MNIVRIAVLAAVVAAPLVAKAQAPADKNGKAVQEVIDFRNRYIEAEESPDMAYLDKIFADDYFAFNPQVSCSTKLNNSPI
jgi:hypothetical protein